MASKPRHFSMLRDFHLADWFTLGNAFCGTGAIFAAMRFLQEGVVRDLLIGMALFCIHFAGTSCWGLIHCSVTARMTASVGSIQNFASFVFASFAPVLTGWILDTTGSFSMALTVCACVTVIGALSYLFIVRDPIVDA